jgi:hypothetical protein
MPLRIGEKEELLVEERTITVRRKLGCYDSITVLRQTQLRRVS